MKIHELNIILSNEEYDLYKKIKKVKKIHSKFLNEREKYLINQLLYKRVINYKIEDGNIFYLIPDYGPSFLY